MGCGVSSCVCGQSRACVCVCVWVEWGVSVGGWGVACLCGRWGGACVGG